MCSFCATLIKRPPSIKRAWNSNVGLISQVSNEWSRLKNQNWIDNKCPASDWCSNENVIFIVMFLFFAIAARVSDAERGTQDMVDLHYSSPIRIIYISIWFLNRFPFCISCKCNAHRRQGVTALDGGGWSWAPLKILDYNDLFSVVKWKRMLITMPQ